MILINKIYSKILFYKQQGYEFFFLDLLSFILPFWDFRLNNLLDKRRGYLAEKISKKANYCVVSGLYKGMILSSKAHWAKGDMGNQILGVYEEAVQNKLKQIFHPNKQNFLAVIGAAEGFHAIGTLTSVENLTCIAYEMSEASRLILNENSTINKVSHRLVIRGKMDQHEMNRLLNENIMNMVLLIDIEGGEFELLDDTVLKILTERNSKMLIELHDFDEISVKKTDELLKRLKKCYKIKELSDEKKSIPDFDLLNDLSCNDRMLVLSEDRPKKGRWIFCE